MTVTFRIDEIRLDTTGGPVIHSFPADLTVLAGPTGVGKTSLLELAKYALGGDGLLTSVAEENISLVHVTIRVGSERMRLSRSVSSQSAGAVQVTDLITGQRLEDHNTNNREPRLSDLLMVALGLPTGLRAAARSAASTRPGAVVTFNDVFHYMYVPQLAINREIAGSSNSYYEPKRKTVFELLFDLTTPELLAMRSELNELSSRAVKATAQVEAVEQFLADSGTTNRIEAELRLENTRSDGAAASAQIAELTEAMVETTDRETQALRDLLAEAERGLAEAQLFSDDLRREEADYAAERRHIELDIARLDRLASAGARMANIEFMFCPRCLQSLNRDVPPGACRVCLQDDVVADLPKSETYERQQLQSQLEEIDQQLLQIRDAQTTAEQSTEDRRKLIQRLTLQIDRRTQQRVSPRLQAYADAARRIERAAVEEEALEAVLRQWDQAQDLREHARRTRNERDTLEAKIRALSAQEAHRRDEVLQEITTEFQSTVQDFGIPNGQQARINPNTYLPELGGRRFDKVSSAGGIATATQVAYWMSLLTVAVRRRDTKYPAFLMIDSPRLALNTAEQMAAQMYRRFVTQVTANPGRLQFIIADNELPAEYGHEFAETIFDYDHPTVPTVKHPGPANVKVIRGND